jgi:hypothetical protein
MPRTLTKIWTYAVEAVSAALFSAVFWLTIGVEKIRAWQVDKKPDLLVSVGIAIAASATIFAAYFALLSTDFGRKLRMHGVAAEYTAAFAFPMILFMISAGTFEFVDDNPGRTFSRFVTFLLCYSCVNCLTMVRNVIELVRLWQDIDRGSAA